jgi:hypothetical protein
MLDNPCASPSNSLGPVTDSAAGVVKSQMKVISTYLYERNNTVGL